MKYSFGHKEKLKSRRHIQALFAEGKALTRFPIRLVYLPVSDSGNHKVGVSVPKRKFNKAVDRNRLKRLLREAYRLNKHQLDELPDNYAIMFIYIGKELTDFDKVQQEVQRLLKDLKKVTTS